MTRATIDTTTETEGAREIRTATGKGIVEGDAMMTVTTTGILETLVIPLHADDLARVPPLSKQRMDLHR